MDTMPTRTIVATDGACEPNPGPGGWAWFTKDGRYDSGHHPATTNNIMELTAIKEAILSLDGPLYIQSDSQYAINCLTKWWRSWQKKGWMTKPGKPVKNRELIESIVAAIEGRDIIWEWVRGHDGHALNEAADDLANAAARRGTPALFPGG